MSVFRTLQAWLKRAWPTRESLAQHAWLGPWAQHLLHRKLWQLHPESVARGVAIGTFWAFAIPLGQTLVAAAHCAWWRGHIPSAAAMTMLTNPLTWGLWVWLAYPVGAWVLQAPASSAVFTDMAWSELLHTLGAPALLGMGILGVAGGALGYLLVKIGWRLRVMIQRPPSNAKPPKAQD